jgi:hypothetical protein
VGIAFWDKEVRLPDRFMDVDLSRVRQLRPFKFDYRRLRMLEYRDPSGRAPQTQSGLPPAGQIQVEQQPRPSFPEELRYLRNYTAQRFPKGKLPGRGQPASGLAAGLRPRRLRMPRLQDPTLR